MSMSYGHFRLVFEKTTFLDQVCTFFLALGLKFHHPSADMVRTEKILC